MTYERELAAVARWCDRTDELALTHFGPAVAVERKADGSDVTVADRGIETMLRAAIADEFPGDAILGEEEGSVGSGPRRWIIDPIDATTNYVRGIPIFATLVALEDEHGLALGFVSAPALRARWWATHGSGAFRDGTPIHVSSTPAIDEMHLATGDVGLFAERGRERAIARLIERVARHRGFGDFYGHVLVAQGSVDAMIDPVVSAWDLAAVKLIVEEAGGHGTTLDGESRYDGGSFASSNGILHDDLLKQLAVTDSSA